MSSTNAFITELVRAANEIRKLTPFERRRLLERAVTMVSDMRGQAGIPTNASGHDKLSDIARVAKETATMDDLIVGHALLEAADMIRDLHVIHYMHRNLPGFGDFLFGVVISCSSTHYARLNFGLY